MTSTACVVQFPHPGEEPVASGDLMAWNTAPGHKRKYLISRGRIVDVRGRLAGEEELMFWGEWEPPSRIVHRWRPRFEMPTVVHEPYWTSPGPRGGRQNTDPWVFGDHFLYSNCKQATHTGRPTSLQLLPVGSVILFGSKLAHRFVLDTVFVVAEQVCRWNPAEGPRLGGRAFDECTVRSLAAADTTFTLYRGATPAEPVHGMFSWVPCAPRHDGVWPRIPRPTVELPGVVNPANGRSTLGAGVQRRLDEVEADWVAVANQVQAQGLNLGYGMEIPPLRPGFGEESDDESEAVTCSRPARPRVAGVIC